MVSVASRNGASESGIDSDDALELEVRRERAPLFDEPPLTLDWIATQTAAGEGADRFGKFRGEAKMADQYYLGEFTFDVPDNGDMIRLGTAQSIVNTVVSHTTPPFTDVTVPPPGPRGTARAEKIERWLRAAMHMMEAMTPARRTISQHQAMYGVAWEKTEFIGANWDSFPEPPGDDASNVENEAYMERIKEIIEDRSIRFPIETTVINPQSLTWDTQNGSNPRWVVAEYEVEATWVTAHFGKSEAHDEWPGNTDGKVLFQEAWTWTQAAYVADGTWAMRPKEHGYSIFPWVMYWPQTGLSTMSGKPDELYRGILHGNFEMIQAESRLTSQYLTIVGQAAWGGIDFKGPRALAEQLKQTYDQRPGAKNSIPEGVDVVPRTVSEPGQTILIAKEALSESIEANTSPRVSRGQRPSGAASGFETSVLAGIAALNFGAIVESNERGLSRRNEIVLHIVEEVIRAPVTVWGKTEAGTVDAKLRPSEIRGHTVNMVTLNATSPEEAQRKLNDWREHWRTGWVDHETSLRKGGVSNALEVIGKVDAETALKSEAVAGALAAEAARRVPLLQQRLEAQEATTGSGAQVEDIAENILNAQGSAQLPNPGNFSSGQQAQTRPNRPIRPVIPGSSAEAAQIGAQAASPRGGPLRTPGRTIPPGGA